MKSKLIPEIIKTLRLSACYKELTHKEQHEAIQQARADTLKILLKGDEQ